MGISPYISFYGNAAEAIEYYKKVFGAKVHGLQKMGDVPCTPDFEIPEEAKNQIAHCVIEIDGSFIHITDNCEVSKAKIGDDVGLVYTSSSEERIKALYEELKSEGNVEMELSPTFWSPAYGVVADKFGVIWNLNAGDKEF